MYLGNIPATSFEAVKKDRFTGLTGTGVTLSHSVSNVQDVVVWVNNVKQDYNNYTVSGTALTLGGSLVSADVVQVLYVGRTFQTVNPSAASVGNNEVASTIITGQTAETSIATDDTVLIHDTSAGALRKMTRANFVSGVGGTNTPAFVAYKNTNQTISNDTFTKITFEAEQLDSDGTFASSRFTPGVAGYYFIGAKWRYDTGTDFDSARYALYKNGSNISKAVIVNQNSNGITFNTIVYSDADDYFEMYGRQNSGSSQTVNGDSTYPEQDQAQFYAFRIIGV